MSQECSKASELGHEETARFVVDLFHRLILHHGLWFAEVKHQVGMERALEMLAEESEKSIGLQLRHLGDLFGFTVKDGVPSFLLEMAPDKLLALKDRLAKNWLANDGIWFQTVEKSGGMEEAKRCNDSCWGQFSPVEAHLVKRFLRFSAQPGLAGLKTALGFRIYESINVQSVVEEGEAVVLYMNQCRVQEARKRKGLPDYPCKSAGLVEYTYFARAIDTRIVTECLGCPPDRHPDHWYCAWRFTLKD